MISFQAIHFVPSQGNQIGIDCCWPKGLWGGARSCMYTEYDILSKIINTVI